MGARVTGSQTTDVNVNVDVVPSATTASFELKVSGNTRSDTKAVKDPATVWTSGNHDSGLTAMFRLMDIQSTQRQSISQSIQTAKR